MSTSQRVGMIMSLTTIHTLIPMVPTATLTNLIPFSSGTIWKTTRETTALELTITIVSPQGLTTTTITARRQPILTRTTALELVITKSPTSSFDDSYYNHYTRSPSDNYANSSTRAHDCRAPTSNLDVST